MKAWNLTYNDPNRWAEVHAISGKPLGFLKGIMQGGTGSPRGVLIEAPGELKALVDETTYVKYCNFQRTESGAILYFKVRLEVYGIPFEKNDLVAMQMASRKSDAFRYTITLFYRSGKQLVIACLEDKAGAWERFLKSVFPKL